MRKMSSILGKEEKNIEGVISYNPQFLDSCVFYGGKERGKCLQLSIGIKHIQLEKEKVIQLGNILIDFLNNYEEKELLIDSKSETLTK